MFDYFFFFLTLKPCYTDLLKNQQITYHIHKGLVDTGLNQRFPDAFTIQTQDKGVVVGGSLTLENIQNHGVK